jgi:hypothetical protein
MPGIFYVRSLYPNDPPTLYSDLAPISATLYAGDVLARTTNAAYSSGGKMVVRDLLAADKTALYGGVNIVSAPSAPTLAAVTAASYGVPFLANGSYTVAITYVSATGETVASTGVSQSTSGGNQAILVSPPAAASGAVGWKVYVSAVGTSTPFYSQSGILSFGEGFAVGGYGASNALVTTGANPPAVNTSGQIAGVAGVSRFSGGTNSSGQWSSFASPAGNMPGQATFQLPTVGAGIWQDPATGQGLCLYYAAVPTNIFAGALNGAVAGPAYNGKIGGIIMSVSGGITTYNVDPAPAAGAGIVRILEADQTDPLYNGGPTGSATGGRVLFQFLESYCQILNSVAYTAQ